MKKLIIIEGYEFTGKSTHAEKVKRSAESEFDQVIMQPKDQNHKLGKIIGYDNLFSSAIVQFNMIKDLKGSLCLIQDRGIFSTLFYSKGLSQEVLDLYFETLNHTFDKIEIHKLMIPKFREKEIYEAIRAKRSGVGEIETYDPADYDEFISNYNRFNDNYQLNKEIRLANYLEDLRANGTDLEFKEIINLGLLELLEGEKEVSSGN